MRRFISDALFRSIHGNSLVYNTCWEDPRLDRTALQLSGGDRLLMITSAGCNALDYALDSPASIECVDINPRQNSLLELKLAAIRKLDYTDFWQFFGNGFHPEGDAIYRRHLRSSLPDFAVQFWDKQIRWFSTAAVPFYFRGTSGLFARMINVYIDRIVRLRHWVNELLSCQSLADQQEIFYKYLWPKFWSRTIRATMRRDTTLAMLGVPREQRKQVEKECDGGIVGFIEQALRNVFAGLPLQDNYFWRVYLTGKYTPDCCPQYLTEDGFQRLKEGNVAVVRTANCSLKQYLSESAQPFSRFVFLDHMDWMADRFPQMLAEQWDWVVRKSTTGARYLWRSGGIRTDYLNRIEVRNDRCQGMIAEQLEFHPELANDLHRRDRVGTYGSFYIADLKAK